ncbi:MAG: Eco57I restriction-modification methylase domain-containing protein [Sulfurimicrobium sp.]|nr:Eco57I restriction-modification methylase domain-containing protein [Sulfurimicrobium sp.]
MREGGFDVVIGNPPYVELRLVRGQYSIQGYQSEPASNLYALCMERSTQLIHSRSTFGMIVPTGLMGLDDSQPLRKLLLSAFGASICSTYAIRPSKLFDGVDQRLCIFLGIKKHQGNAHLWTTRYHHWNSDERPALFQRLTYTAALFNDRLKVIPQVGSPTSLNVMTRLERLAGKTIALLYARNGAVLHYHRSPRYWIRAMDFEPFFQSATRSRSVHHFRDLILKDLSAAHFVGSVVNSSLFFYWFVVVGNGRNITGRDVEQFPAAVAPISDALGKLFDDLMEDYKRNSIIRERRDCSFQEFKPSLSKQIIDKIDLELGKLFCLSDEETDFIINYDIKYRMGGADEEE